jgi:TolA-binding protein
MQGLPILIRLARQRADERRAILAEAERQTLLAAEILGGHEAHLRRETERARGQAEEMALWSDWSRLAAGRQRQLRHALTTLRVQEEQIRDALREDFAEIKRLEIARDTAAEAARRQAARRAERMTEDAELRRAARAGLDQRNRLTG